MFESPKAGKIVAIVLVFALSASIFSLYTFQEEHTDTTKINVAILPFLRSTNSYYRVPIYVYNQFGEPVKGLGILYSGTRLNVTNQNGCAIINVLRYCSECSQPPGNSFNASKLSYTTIFGTHNFNSISNDYYSLGGEADYFSAMVQSPSDPNEPAIMVHYYLIPGSSIGNYVSCVTLSCYKSNHTIQYGSNPQEKLLGTYQNFTNIVIPISKYLKTDENYQFTTGGIFTKYYYINSSEVTNLTDLQKNYNQIIWNDIFQVSFIIPIIILSGIFFTPPKIKIKKGELSSARESLFSLKEPIIHSIIPVGTGLIIGIGSIIAYSFYTHTEPFAAYPISIIASAFFLTVFMAVIYSIGSLSKNPEKSRNLIMVLSTIIEIAWVTAFTIMEIIFDGSKNVFSSSVNTINSIMASIQYFNPFQYSMLIIETMNHLMIMPAALAQYITGYDYIIVMAGSIISLLSLIYVYLRMIEDSYFE